MPSPQICRCGCGKPVGKQGCTTHSKRTKLLCGAQAMKGMHVCRNHGGKSLAGQAHPNCKHGQYSKHSLQGMPSKLLASFEAYVQDPEIMSLVGSVALLKTRAGDLLGRLAENDGLEGSAASLRAYRDFLVVNPPQSKRATEKAAEVLAMLEAQAKDMAVWHEVFRLEDQRARTVNVESLRRARELDSLHGADIKLFQLTILHVVATTLAKWDVPAGCSAELARRFHALAGHPVKEEEAREAIKVS